jgi:hypothetical protein
MQIDHVIYGTADLDAAAARLEADLGLTAVAGGRHDGVGTHNRIVPLKDGAFIELLGIADPAEATRSPVGSVLQASIARGDGLIGWAVAVDEVEPVAERLGTSISSVRRGGMTARLTAVAEALAEPCLPFFIERSAGRPGPPGPEVGISWIEVSGDADRLECWLGGRTLPVRVVPGKPGLRALGLGERELRTS